MSADRTYWRVLTYRPDSRERAWHAAMRIGDSFSLCGRVTPEPVAHADRLPPAAHLCGNCARSIAARTDVEAPTVVDVGEQWAEGASV